MTTIQINASNKLRELRALTIGRRNRDAQERTLWNNFRRDVKALNPAVSEMEIDGMWSEAKVSSVA